LITVLTEPKNMLIFHAFFLGELFPWFIFSAKCEILNFVDVGRCTRTVSLHGWPLACYQSNGLILLLVLFFIQKSYSINIQFCVHCLETSCTNLHLCNPCWLANV